jgi:AGZA family xanthine/uracil permease-like MFS transporter
MMLRNVTRIDWSDFTEAFPAFLVLLGIPLTYSIADGLALGFICHPLLKLLTGRGRETRWFMHVIAALLAAYFVLVRAKLG